MKVTKKTRLLAKREPIFEDAALGIKVFKVEPESGETLKLGENWKLIGSGLKVGPGGFMTEEASCSVWNDPNREPVAYAPISMTASEDGTSMLLTANLDLSGVEPGERQVQFSIKTIDGDGCFSQVFIHSFMAVKE